MDIQHSNVLIEISGTEGKVEAFIELMRPYGILELARTGRIAASGFAATCSTATPRPEGA